MSGATGRSYPATRRSWGWHRLSNHWARRVVDLASPQPGRLVVDLGAGDGALVGPLLARGVRVIAVELHAGRARGLRDRYSQQCHDGRLVVVESDLLDFRLPRGPFQVVASPPYALASTILARLVAPGSRLVSAHLVLPRVVARRWAEGGVRVAQRSHRRYAIGVAMLLPRRAFDPPPLTDSAVLAITRRTDRAG